MKLEIVTAALTRLKVDTASAAGGFWHDEDEEDELTSTVDEASICADALFQLADRGWMRELTPSVERCSDISSSAVGNGSK